MVAALAKNNEDRSELRWTILEAKEYLQTLPDWKIRKVRRECNKVPHELANLARCNIHTATWLRQAPAWIIDLLNIDRNSRPS
jgi:hypothetical protein